MPSSATVGLRSSREPESGSRTRGQPAARAPRLRGAVRRVLAPWTPARRGASSPPRPTRRTLRAPAMCASESQRRSELFVSALLFLCASHRGCSLQSVVFGRRTLVFVRVLRSQRLLLAWGRALLHADRYLARSVHPEDSEGGLCQSRPPSRDGVRAHVRAALTVALSE